MLGLSEYDAALLDKPSVLSPCCAVCGKPWSNEHHVVFKGHGGLPRKIERRIPLIRLCGNGNTSGCHGEVHHRRLFFRWRDGWEYMRTDKPMTVDAAMAQPGWRKLYGWVMCSQGSSLLGAPLQETARAMGYESAKEYLMDRFYDE